MHRRLSRGCWLYSRDVVLVRDIRDIYGLARVVNVKMWRADSLHAANGRSLLCSVHAGPRPDPSKTDESGGTASDSVPSYIILALIRVRRRREGFITLPSFNIRHVQT
jgi:hypothetical protein